MEVLMIDTVPRVGRKGDFKTVAEGFARNYLFPRNYAIPATEGAKKHRNGQAESSDPSPTAMLLILLYKPAQ